MLRTFDIPTDSSQLAHWLDERLASPDLPDVVAELLAVQHLPLAPPAPINLRAELGPALATVLERGTGALSADQRRELLRQPWRLLALQEAIDEAGGPFWNEVAHRSNELTALLTRGRERLSTHLQTVASNAPQEQTRPATPASSTKSQRSGSKVVRALLAIATVAAVVLVAVFVNQRPGGPPAAQVAWGWNEQELFGGSPTRQEYLDRLADAGAKWSKKRPEKKEEVAQRIREMIAGCQRLIDRDHPPLVAADQDDLKKLCKNWLKKFEEQLAAVESTEKSPLEARDAMDEIVDKLVKRLKSGQLS